MKNRDLASGLVWMGFGILFVVGSLMQGLMRKGVPGPGFLPFISGIFLIALSFMVLIPALSNKKTENGATQAAKFFPEKDSLKKVLLALVGLFAYGVSLEYTGYLINTFFLMLLMARLIQRVKWRTVLILSLSTAILSYLLFVVLLNVQLPKGVLGI